MTNAAGNFSSNVGEAHGPRWLEWLAPLVGNPARGLELGTWKGESADWMLNNIFTHPESRYHCVDTFAGSEEHRLAGLDLRGLEAEATARLKRHGRRVRIHKGETNAVLRELLRLDEFDFVYVDGPHDAMNVLRDSVLAFDLLVPGGVMVWDDYGWTSMEQALDRPKMAIDSFLASYARRLEVIGLGWQVAVKKIA